MATVNLLDENLILWNEFRNGDVCALGELMRTHYRDLFHYGTRFTKNEQLVKDCIQDLFLVLWTRRLAITDTSFVKYYLLTSLRQTLIPAISPSRRRAEPGFQDLFHHAPSLEDRRYPEEQQAGLARRMRKMLAGLSRRQQEVIYLRFYMEADVEEIADIMCLSAQSVHHLLYDTLRRLAKVSPKKTFRFPFDDLLFSHSFRNWVLTGDAPEAEFWTNWMARNPDKAGIVNHVRAVIYSLQLNLEPPLRRTIHAEVEKVMQKLKDGSLNLVQEIPFRPGFSGRRFTRAWTIAAGLAFIGILAWVLLLYLHRR